MTREQISLWPRSMRMKTAERYFDATPWAIEKLCRSGQFAARKKGNVLTR
jgi:hypothetical protein